MTTIDLISCIKELFWNKFFILGCALIFTLAAFQTVDANSMVYLPYTNSVNTEKNKFITALGYLVTVIHLLLILVLMYCISTSENATTWVILIWILTTTYVHIFIGLVLTPDGFYSHFISYFSVMHVMLDCSFIYYFSSLFLKKKSIILNYFCMVTPLVVLTQTIIVNPSKYLTVLHNIVVPLQDAVMATCFVLSYSSLPKSFQEHKYAFILHYFVALGEVGLFFIPDSLLTAVGFLTHLPLLFIYGRKLATQRKLKMMQ